MSARLSLVLSVSALALIVLACGSSTPTSAPVISTATTQAAVGATQAQATQAPASTAEPTVAAATEVPATATAAPMGKLGDTVEQGGYSITAAAVQDPCKPGLIYQKKADVRIVGVQVILANVSSADALDVNPLYATLLDSEGFTYKAGVGICDSQIDVVKLAKGEKVKGIIGFEIPKGAKVASIKYSPGFLGTTILQTGLVK